MHQSIHPPEGVDHDSHVRTHEEYLVAKENFRIQDILMHSHREICDLESFMALSTKDGVMSVELDARVLTAEEDARKAICLMQGITDEQLKRKEFPFPEERAYVILRNIEKIRYLQKELAFPE
jgi:hypothetical protein